MKSMTLTTTHGPIPTNILALAVDINSRVGDQDITVTIHDGATGREYTVQPTERRTQNDAQRSHRGCRALRASNA